MDRLGEKTAIGRFEIEEDRWIHGELSVAGEKSSLYLRDPEFLWCAMKQPMFCVVSSTT